MQTRNRIVGIGVVLGSAFGLLGGGLTPSAAHAQTSGSSAEAGWLMEEYPGVSVHYEGDASWEVAQMVFGRAMNTAETPGEALDDWLAEHAGVFGEDAPDYTIENQSELGDGRMIIRFRQRIGETPVMGGQGRAMLAETVSGWTVTMVSAALLDVPSTGLATPIITGPQAETIASEESELSGSYTTTAWGEPVLVASRAHGGENPIAAIPVWRLSGVGHGEGGLSLPVLVDVNALTGDIVFEHGQVAGFQSTVTGEVDGEVLQGLEPFADPIAFPCINTDTDFEFIPHMLVELADTPSGATVTSTRTDNSGQYTFNGVTTYSTSVVRFVPQHEFFKLATVTDAGFDVPFPTPDVYVDWEYLEGVEQNALTDPDYTYENIRGFGEDPEYAIVDMSVYKTIDQARDFYRTRLSPMTYYVGLDDDDLTIIANERKMRDAFQIPFAAGYFPRDAEMVGQDPLFGVPVLAFVPEYDDPARPNFGYSTVATHEYGHFALDEAFGIGIGYPAIHEGYADILSILHHQTDIIGYGGLGCSGSTPLHVREWDLLETAWTSGQICAASPYHRAEQLVLIWREIEAALGNSTTSQLFVDWSFLATPDPTMNICGQGRDRSVRTATLFEVLVADDDNNTLNDGTPNDEAICAAFAEWGIVPGPGDPDVCEESAGGQPILIGCVADLDRDGVLTLFDFVKFQSLFESGDHRADINDDGSLDVLDFLAFQNAFELQAGCR
jgi:hypothetical protein